MKINKSILLILLSVSLANLTFAQAPSISFTSSFYKLTIGSNYSLTPVNSGGAVPATNYGQVTIFAGSPTEIAGYQDGTGTAALFNFPQQMTMDASGNLYVADATNSCIREITSAGVVTTFAGSVSSGFTDATGTAAQFNYPDGLTIDGSGNLYVSDYNNDAIRKITSSGVVTTFYNASGATFGPGGLCFDNSGNLIVSAQDASQIISINSSGVATVIAGTSPGYANGSSSSAQFNTPTDVRVDASGNIFVVDFENNAVREITPAGVVSTYAGSNVNGNTPGYGNGIGTNATFNNPSGLVIGTGGPIYVADLYNNDIRRIMPDGTVSLLAGSSSQAPGDADGVGTAAGFNLPDYMYIDGTGNGYIAELGGNRIRKIVLTGYTLQGTLPAGLSFNSTTGIVSGSPTTVSLLPIIDTVTAWNSAGYASVVVAFGVIPPPPVIAYDIGATTLVSGTAYTVTPTNAGGAVPAYDFGQVTTLAGSTSGTSGYTNATGTSARFHQPAASVTDAAGNLYIADGSNNAIRKIDPTGVVTTFAGSASGASGSTDGTGTAAAFNNPQGLAIDAAGNLIVSDYGNNSIRKIDINGVVTTFYHSTSTFGPVGLTVDPSGNIIVAAKDLHQILLITPAAVASTIAGSTSGYTNATGTSAQFNTPTDVKIDASSNLFVADYANNAIREITPAGVVTTFAGSAVSGNTGAYLDGIGTAAEFNNPAGLAIAAGGVIYVADMGNNDIRQILPDGTTSLVAGSASQSAGNGDGTGQSASFNQPNSISIDNTATGYVTELGGNRARKLTLTGYALAGTLPSGLTLDPSTGTISGTYTGTITPTQVTVTAFNSGGLSLVMPLLMPATNDWLGGTSTAWGLAANWRLARIPISTDIVRIGVAYAYTNQPTLSTTTPTTVSTLSFGAYSPGAPILTIATGASLTATVGITIAASTVATINGPGALALTSTTTISSTSSLITGSELVITLNGYAIISNTSGGTFTLGSDINGCVAIATMPSTASVKGLVTVQRYISGNSTSYRGYRDMASPVYAGNDGNANVYSINYVGAAGATYTSGGTGVPGGFSETGNPSLYVFTQDHFSSNASFDGGNYKGIYDMALPSPAPAYEYEIDPTYVDIYLPVGTGFLCYFRGGSGQASPYIAATSSPYTPGSLPSPAVFATTGTLNQGNVMVQDWYTEGSTTLTYNVITGPPSNAGYEGEHLIGNPYPSSIDWNTTLTSGILVSGIDSYIYELNNNNGSYAIYDTTTPGMNTSEGSNIIQSGAAFYITTGTSGGTLTFTESAKAPTMQIASGNPEGVLMDRRVTQQASGQYLRLEMNADTIHYEDAIVAFNNANKIGYEPHLDVRYKLGHNIVSLSTLSSDNVQLGINKQPLPGNERRIIGLHVDVAANGTYHFNLRQVIGLPKLYDVWLLDAYKRDSIDLRAAVTYDFAVDKSDSSSFGSNRFSLLIKQNPANVYRLLNFAASKVANASRQVQVAWQTQNEENYTNFTVERSTDGGETFTVLAMIPGSSLGHYNVQDNNPVIGQNFYRLKQVDFNNVITYSKTVLIRYDNLSDQKSGNRLNIFPNPASSQISLSVIADTNEPAVYKVSFNSSMGAVVREFTLSQAAWQGNVSDLLPGTYLVTVVNKSTQAFVAQGKFVKL